MRGHKIRESFVCERAELKYGGRRLPGVRKEEQFKEGHHSYCKVPPELSPLWKPDVVQNHQQQSVTCVFRRLGTQSSVDVIAYRPQAGVVDLHNHRAKSVVRKPLCRIEYGIMSELQM